MATVTVQGEKVEVTEEERARYLQMVAEGYKETTALQIATGEYRDLIRVEE